MVSRKKIKGKDRKAKQAKQEAEKIEKQRLRIRCEWVGWASSGGLQCRERYDNSGGAIVCDHGFADLIPDEDNHPVCVFLDIFFMDYLGCDDICITVLLNNTYKKQPQVWENDILRKQARDLLVSIGANMILGRKHWPRGVAAFAVALENYDHTCDINSMIYKHEVGIKLRDLYCGGNAAKRGVLKFFRKRTSCQCLKKMHLEARKHIQKLGDCYFCLKVKDRSELMVCSRCRVAQYCSRQCQVKAWSRHEDECDHFVCARKKSTMES